MNLGETTFTPGQEPSARGCQPVPSPTVYTDIPCLRQQDLEAVPWLSPLDPVPERGCPYAVSAGGGAARLTGNGVTS